MNCSKQNAIFWYPPLSATPSPKECRPDFGCITEGPRPSPARPTNSAIVDVIPDILANAGGVIVSYLNGYKPSARSLAGRADRDGTCPHSGRGGGVFDHARENGLDYRSAAFDIAVARVKEALDATGF